MSHDDGVTVFLADDHPLYREALAGAIRACPGLELVGAAADGPGAVEGIARLEPRVAVLDVRLPGCDGLEVARRISGGDTRVLFLSAHAEGPVVYGSLATGAVGYLTKDASGQEICGAIRRVASGGRVLGAAVGDQLIAQIQARGARPERPPLTAREQQVLTLAAEGASVAMMGQRLHLSAATIKTHLHRLYGKLGVRDRGSAVAEGMRRGLLS